MTDAQIAELRALAAQTEAARARGERPDPAILGRVSEILRDTAVQDYFDPAGLLRDAGLCAGLGYAIAYALEKKDKAMWAASGAAVGATIRGIRYALLYGVGTAGAKLSRWVATAPSATQEITQVDGPTGWYST
jgi:hypothetical protein